MIKLTKGFLSLAIFFCATSPVFANADNTNAATWELKGVHLGDSLDSFRAKFPNAQCETSPMDAHLVDCADATTFSDKPATFRAHFLEGRAVRVAIEKIDAEATLAAATPLIEKYGEPKYKKKQRGNFIVKNEKVGFLEPKEMMQSRSYDTWIWQQGQLELRTLPLDDSVRDTKFTWSAIVLVDHFRYDEVFWPRWRGKAAASIPSIEAARNDI